MRRTGKTTLLIDAAIQELFTKGEVYIPNAQEATKLISKDGRRGMTDKKFKQKTKFIESDFSEKWPGTQDYFVERFRQRLFSEHSVNYFIDKRTYYKLSDDYNNFRDDTTS